MRIRWLSTEDFTNAGHLGVTEKLTMGLWSMMKESGLLQKLPSEKSCLESIECVTPLESAKVD